MADRFKLINAVRRALRERPQTHSELVRAVLGERYSFEQWEEFREAWNYVKAHPSEVTSEQRPVGGTGIEHAQAFETYWRLIK